MKVLCVINRLVTGGAEKLILDTLPLMNNHLDCHLYLLSQGDFPFEKKLKSNTTITILKTKWSSLYNPLHLLQLIKLMHKYDIVHVHLFPSQYYVWIAKILSFSKAKIIVTEHNTTNNRLGNKFFKLFDRLTYKFFDKTICISEEIQAIMQRYTKLPLDNFPIIQNGISLNTINDAFPLDKTTINNTDEDNIIILQVSGFRLQKDQHTVIKSLVLLPENVKIWFAGTGITLADCQALTKSLGFENRVIFLGVRTDIPQLLKTADIVVLSSHYEGLSLASIEGMASGKPFVASDVPGLREVVKDAGLLFENKNEKQLAHHILSLLEDSDYYKKVAFACQEKAKQFDIEKMVDQQVELYKSLCQQSQK